LAPLEAAAFVAREPLARFVAGLEDFGLLDDARFAGGIAWAPDLTFSRSLRAYPNCGNCAGVAFQPINSSSSAFCAWRRFSA
jgi:hypothetical protein